MAIMPVNKIGTNGQMIVQSEWFVARITEVDASETGTGSCAGTKHGWIEQAVCNNGTAYEDAPAEQAEAGDVNYNSAYPINGGTATVNDLVLMRVKGLDDDGLSVYEFLPIPTSGGSGYVTSVQCTSGMLVVTYD
jgi:hypothetical protein